MLITESKSLAEFCAPLRGAPFLAVDTEFVREKTYYARLCLVQVASAEHAAVVDMLAPGIDVAPLQALLCDPNTVKVFHSAGQDLEIFYQEFGSVLAPVFDTQIVASVSGHGDQPGYGALVSAILGEHIDKASQATDWTLRPLTDRQVAYALEDVTHLARLYPILAAELERTGRASWIAEEMAALVDVSRCEVDPDQAWRRIKLRHGNPKALAVLREVATWRERTAIARNLPRGWVVRDDAIAEIALHAPADEPQLARVRGLKPGFARSADGAAILAAVERALARPEDWPERAARRDGATPDASLVALLQALLRLRCEAHGVAARMVAKREDLELIAAGAEPEMPVLEGWRRQVFGADALALCAGRIALTGEGMGVREVGLTAPPGALDAS